MQFRDSTLEIQSTDELAFHDSDVAFISVNSSVSKKIAPLAINQGTIVLDDIESLQYPTPVMASGLDDVLVGRIRADVSIENGLVLWLAIDNLRKGAATKALQMIEYLAQKRFIG